MDKKLFTHFLEKLSLGIIIVVFFLFPLLFLPMVSDVFVVPKQLLTIFSVIVLALLWAVKLIVDGRISFLSNPFNLAFFLFGVSILCSSLFSQNRYDSMIQTVPVITLLILAFLLINLLNKKEFLGNALNALMLGGVASTIISLLYFVHIYILPFGNPNNPLFTTFGSPIQHVGYLIPLFVLSCTFIYGQMQENRFEKIPLNSRNVFYTFSMIVLLLGIGLNIYKIFFEQERPIVLPVQYGIQIATASLGQDMQRQLPSLLFGSGLGTFLTDFTRFKPISFNLEPLLWNLNIGFSSSVVLEFIATLGIVGTLSFGFILLRFFKNPPARKLSPLYNALISAAMLIFIIPYSFSFIFLFFVLLSFYVGILHSEKNKKVYQVNLSLVRPREGFLSVDTDDNRRRDNNPALPIVMATILLSILLAIGFYSIRYVRSDMNFKRAQSAETLKNAQVSYDLMKGAIALFPYRDEYYRVFSKLNLSIANSLTSSLKQGEQPTAEVQQTVFSLLQQSINAARSAVIVAPLTASNWTNLGSIYKSLIKVGKNAEQFALASYQEAIRLNQYDPQNYIETGGIFHQLGQYDAAITQFQNAVTLKSDLPNAHYNLGHSFEAKGDYSKALAEYETVRKLTQQNEESVQKIEAEIEAIKVKAADYEENMEGISANKNESKEKSGVMVGPEEQISLPGLPKNSDTLQDGKNSSATPTLVPIATPSEE